MPQLLALEASSIAFISPFSRATSAAFAPSPCNLDESGVPRVHLAGLPLRDRAARFPDGLRKLFLGELCVRPRLENPGFQLHSRTICGVEIEIFDSLA